jgi:hypothetical protein
MPTGPIDSFVEYGAGIVRRAIESLHINEETSCQQTEQEATTQVAAPEEPQVPSLPSPLQTFQQIQTPPQVEPAPVPVPAPVVVEPQPVVVPVVTQPVKPEPVVVRPAPVIARPAEPSIASILPPEWTLPVVQPSAPVAPTQTASVAVAPPKKTKPPQFVASEVVDSTTHSYTFKVQLKVSGKKPH